MNKHLMFMVLISLLIGTSCNTSSKKEKSNTKVEKQVVVPNFQADSAYYYVAAQLAFGPRVPNTLAHTEAAKYLAHTLSLFADTVITQEFRQRAFDGTILNGKNIIGSFNSKKTKRILLAAHWDSRPFADHDPNEENHHTPIDGANDGASGVGVLLEIARQMAIQLPDVGVDIIFFDLEDYGVPQFMNSSDNNSWALGSQYWANNPHDPNYTANYGILLDMVGASNPVFKMEYYSKMYAPHIVKKVWKQAGLLGYGSTFLFEDGGMVMDDHIPVNEILRIPMIDIIHYDPSTHSGFFPHWHTINDNLEIIDPVSLEMVGETIMHVIYYE
ncbi:MAG: glutamine cyclotransferase [Bacteroidetes bacterium 4572_77]|nr:MAG: glutamine cyclotransferase [Bacteroidetes bacterium 4572_77]